MVEADELDRRSALQTIGRCQNNARTISIVFEKLDHTMEAASRRAERVIGKLRQTSAA
ncbi:MAG: hypothetical protein AAFU56_10480 [Pseudomonadota bacterium]